MKKIIVIKVTFASKEEAKKVALTLLEKKLAACAQIAKIESFYRFDGEICHDDEFLLTIKSEKSLYRAIEAEILTNHSYKVPQIVSFEVDEALDGYKKWLLGSILA